MTRILTIMLAVLAATFAAAAVDGPPLNPVNQPLVVLRAPNGAAVEAVLETNQAKALGLDKKDFSGAIPGVDARIDSLQAFVAGLNYSRAENLWYCLSQSGSSLANQTGAMGWDAADSKPDAPLPQVAKWLGELGLDIKGQDLEVRPIDNSHARIIISKDADARQEILGGAGRPDGGWRSGLAQFAADQNGGVGVWANTRPLLGLLSILTGIDFRAKMNAHNMGVPVSAQVNLGNNKGDLSIDARLNNILPEEWPKGTGSTVRIQTRPDALFDLNFPTPAKLWDMMDAAKDSLFLANINILPLIPRAVNVTSWRGDDGQEHWSMVCLMGNKDKFNEQLKRLHAWLQIISAVSSDAFALSTSQSTWGDELWNVRLGQDSFVMGVVDVEAAGRDNAFLVISGAAKDWPNPFEIKVTNEQDGTLVHCNVNLDPKTRGELVQALADMSQEKGAKDFTLSFWEKFVPHTDTFAVWMEGKSLCAYSTHGLMPVLVPGAVEMIRKQLDPQAPAMQKVASRLRFLLDLAGQSRFRALTGGETVPAQLPGSLSELLFSDPQGRAWLDREFGVFPDAFGNVSDVLTALAAGKGLDGFRYHIDAAPDGWNVTAENDQGKQMRIDSQGKLSVADGGAWTAYVEPLINFSRYLQ